MVSNVVLPSGGELARIYPSIILNGDNVVCKKYNMDNDDLVWFESVDFDDSDLNKLKSRIGGDWVGRNGSIGKFEMDVWHFNVLWNNNGYLVYRGSHERSDEIYTFLSEKSDN
jgi:hypothetical protein